MCAVQQPSESRASDDADLAQPALHEACGTAITQHWLADGPLAPSWRLCIATARHVLKAGLPLAAILACFCSMYLQP